METLVKFHCYSVEQVDVGALCASMKDVFGCELQSYGAYAKTKSYVGGSGWFSDAVFLLSSERSRRTWKSKRELFAKMVEVMGGHQLGTIVKEAIHDGTVGHSQRNGPGMWQELADVLKNSCSGIQSAAEEMKGELWGARPVSRDGRLAETMREVFWFEREDSTAGVKLTASMSIWTFRSGRDENGKFDMNELSRVSKKMK